MLICNGLHTVKKTECFLAQVLIKFEMDDISDEDLEEILNKADKDGNGIIDLNGELSISLSPTVGIIMDKCFIQITSVLPLFTNNILFSPIV